MVRSLKLLKIVAAISLVLSTSAFADPSVQDLQRDLNARNAAMLDLLNRVNDQEKQLLELTGQVEELKLKVKALEEKPVVTTTQPQVPTTPVVAPVGTPIETPKVQEPTLDNKQVALVSPVATNVQVAKDKKEYDEAYQKVINGEFDVAQTKFDNFIKNYPDSTFVPNAYYWKGQIYFKTKNFKLARENFLKVTQFKDSNKRAEAILKLGQISESLNEKEKAIKFYQLVVKSYPNNTEAVLATQAIQKLSK